MSKIQLIRHAVGMPPELDASRAISRDDSFCQFVVKADGPYVINDAPNDTRIPQLLVQVYGFGAYMGVPVRVGGQTIGTLCVADGKPRDWPAGLEDVLMELALRVSERLEEMSRAGAPTFEGVSDPSALSANVASLASVIQRSLVEVGPMVRLAKGINQGIAPDALVRAARVVTQASDFYDDMLAAVNELCGHASQLERSVSARGG
jgi:hypothetical protein